MPAGRQRFQFAGFLPDDLRAAIARRLAEIIGVALIVVSGALAAALGSWSVQDPSLSHATSAPVRNLLGVPGAVAADLLMQLVGIGALALILPVAVWGWRLITHRPLDRERLRLILWTAGVLAATAFASCLPTGTAWPLPTGLGGVVGDALLRLPAWLFGAPLKGGVRIALALIAGLAALVALALAMGFEWRRKRRRAAQPVETDNEGRPSVSLGWLYHALLSVTARLARMFARRPPSPRHPAAPAIAPGEYAADDEPEIEEDTG